MYAAVLVISAPENVGCDTAPAGVYAAVDVISAPLNVGCDTVPAGVYAIDTSRVAGVPLND